MKLGSIAARAERLRRGVWLDVPRVPARHAEWSVIASADDLLPAAPDELIGLALRAADRARTTDLSGLAARATNDLDGRFLQQWPGEHYRLLAALIGELQPAVAVEIGTFTGMGALAMLEGMKPEGRLVTYDIIPWHEIPGTLLRKEDFDDRLEQRLLDLQDPANFDAELPTLRDAGLIFIDGPKDGRFEPRLVTLLADALGGQGTILVFDDIRVMAMVKLWREMPFPRLDLTSFGHWSGTGLCMLM